jgi:predicted RNA-binding protein with RPS1 domain
MVLEGVVTNVTNFGAFVDIGIQQDGLVHLSQMSNRFIRDPREVVSVGDVVQVKVVSVEADTKRIGLSIKALLPPPVRRRRRPPRTREGRPADGAPGNGALAPPVNGTDASGESGRPARPRGRPRPGERRGRRRPLPRPVPPKPGPEPTSIETVDEPADPPEPEPSLQEKIALLQSKFRGIS